jgi:hypothetical protein
MDFRPNEPITARLMGQIMRQLRGMIQVERGWLAMANLPEGVVIKAGPRIKNRPIGAGGAIRFRVKEISYDWIRCRNYDGTTEGTSDVYVAKGWTWRKTGHITGYTYDPDGVTRTYTAESETQTLFPPLAIDDDILAEVIDGGTGVSNPIDSSEIMLMARDRFWSREC